MNKRKNAQIQNNHLIFAGVDTVKLVEKYKTPVYVMDEDLICENINIYKKAINDYYDGNGLVLYASKAFSAKEIYRIVKKEQIGCDVVSGGEIATALKAGFPVDKMYFHGNNKTADELEFAFANGVVNIVADNETELYKIKNISDKLSVIPNVLLRIKPGVEAHTHEYIQTGQIDSKFGFALENGEAICAVRKALELNLNLVGIHCHIGSQIFDYEPFEKAVEIMCKFICKIKNELGINLSVLNMGGGYGIRYTDNDTPINYDEYIKNISFKIKKLCNELGIQKPFLLAEPGRSIVANSGITLYTIGSVKEIKNIRTYVSVDGGMTDNPRFALYRSEYDMTIANKAGDEKSEVVTVAGKCCETGDLLGKDVKLQKAESGDILAVFDTGAYNYSMAMNYNRIPKPPVIMLKGGEDRVIIKRETYDDLIKNDI